MSGPFRQFILLSLYNCVNAGLLRCIANSDYRASVAISEK